MNAPEAGTIKEFFVSEEDTVTVGQDLVRIELGGSPSGDSKKPSLNPENVCEDSVSDNSTKKAAQPETIQDGEKSGLGQWKAAEQRNSDNTPARKPEELKHPDKNEAQFDQTVAVPGFPTIGSRDERRVCNSNHPFIFAEQRLIITN